MPDKKANLAMTASGCAAGTLETDSTRGLSATIEPSHGRLPCGAGGGRGYRPLHRRQYDVDCREIVVPGERWRATILEGVHVQVRLPLWAQMERPQDSTIGVLSDQLWLAMGRKPLWDVAQYGWVRRMGTQHGVAYVLVEHAIVKPNGKRLTCAWHPEALEPADEGEGATPTGGRMGGLEKRYSSGLDSYQARRLYNRLKSE